MQPEAKLELKHEAETYGERLIDEVDAVREWLRKMPLRYQQWPTDPAYRRAVVNDFPFRWERARAARGGPCWPGQRSRCTGRDDGAAAG